MADSYWRIFEVAPSRRISVTFNLLSDLTSSRVKYEDVPVSFAVIVRDRALFSDVEFLFIDCGVLMLEKRVVRATFWFCWQDWLSSFLSRRNTSFKTANLNFKLP